MQLNRTPEEIIESRTLHIKECRKALQRKTNTDYHEDYLREIKSCEEEIRRAKARIEMGLNDPYYSC